MSGVTGNALRETSNINKRLVQLSMAYVIISDHENLTFNVINAIKRFFIKILA